MNEKHNACRSAGDKHHEKLDALREFDQEHIHVHEFVYTIYIYIYIYNIIYNYNYIYMHVLESKSVWREVHATQCRVTELAFEALFGKNVLYMVLIVFMRTGMKTACAWVCTF